MTKRFLAFLKTLYAFLKVILLPIGYTAKGIYAIIRHPVRSAKIAGAAVYFVVRHPITSWRIFYQFLRRAHKRFVRPAVQYLFSIFKLIFPWILAVTLAALLARSILSLSPTKVVAIFLAGCLMGIIWRRIEVGIVLLLIMVATIFYASVFPKVITIGGFGPWGAETLLIALIGVGTVRFLANRNSIFPRSPVTLPLVVFYISIIISMANSYFNYLQNPRGWFDFKTVYNTCRPLFFYLFFFVIAFGLQTERELKVVLKSAVVMSVIVSILMVVQAALGTSHRVFFGTEWSPKFVNPLSPEEQEVARSLPPGLSLSQMIFIPVLYLTACQKGKSAFVYGIAYLCMLIGLAFSFTRNYWFTAAVCSVLLIILAGRGIRGRLIGITAILLVSSILLSFVVGNLMSAAGSEFGPAMVRRFQSLINKEAFESASFENRREEVRRTWPQILRNPIFGVGPGKPFYYDEIRLKSGQKLMVEHSALHNSYLELWLVYGIFGLGSFIWLSIAFLVRAICAYRRLKNPYYKAWALGLGIAYIGFLIRANIGMHILHEPPQMLSVALSWGIIDVMLKLERAKAEAFALQTAQKLPIPRRPLVNPTIS